MNTRNVLRFIGILLFFLGLFMVPSLILSLLDNDGGASSLFGSIIITSVCGMILFYAVKGSSDAHLGHRDGIAIVTLGWLSAGLFGALPYILSGTIPSFTNAYFESISGFTTTGASILSDIESLPMSILLWRSISQWLGGMGIIVLSIAILPFLGIGGMQLYKAEIPSPVVDKLTPRISDTAKALWLIYVAITLLEIILLSLGDMPLFEAVCHGLCTMPTGGFSPMNTSIANYNNAYYDIVIIIFMLLAGINFSLHYKLIKGNFLVFGKDPECRIFLVIVAFVMVLVTLDIYGSIHNSLSEAFRYAAFQVASVITTTGFMTADFDQWPAFSKKMLILCMFMGGMAGSTAGGIKTMRIIVMVKHAYSEIFKIIHPRAVTAVKLAGKAIPAEVLSSIWGFFILYIMLFVSASMIMALIGLDLISAFTSVAACIFNIGPGLGVVGPTQNFSEIPESGKWVLIFCMLLGRLEIYTILAFLAPEYWRK